MPHAIMRYPDPIRRPANHGAKNMRKLARSLAALAVILLPALYSAPAHALVFHLWVSHTGSDSNNCYQGSPCASFGQALSVTPDGGEVSCVDSADFGAFTVTISVIIDCTGTVAAPSSGGFNCTNAILINAPGRVVTLRGLDVTGIGSSCGTISGIVIEAASAVYIEDCVIENFPQKGIVDARTTGLTKLVIKNTIVRNNGFAGIVAGAAPRNSVVLENVESVGNAYGIGVATGNNVVISRSVMSENSIAGIEADPEYQDQPQRKLWNLCPGNGHVGQLGYFL
jgi:hypothetical protein